MTVNTPDTGPPGGAHKELHKGHMGHPTKLEGEPPGRPQRLRWIARLPRKPDDGWHPWIGRGIAMIIMSLFMGIVVLSFFGSMLAYVYGPRAADIGVLVLSLVIAGFLLTGVGMMLYGVMRRS